MRILLILLSFCLVSSPLLAQEKADLPIALGEKVEDFLLPDIHGNYYQYSDYPQDMVLFYFWSHKCPQVAQQIPELQKLVEENRKWGFSVFGVVAESDGSREELQQYLMENGIPFPILVDKKQQLQKLFGATTTPEVFFVNEFQELKYRGAFNDAAKQAIKAVIFYDKIEQPETIPSGCLIGD